MLATKSNTMFTKQARKLLGKLYASDSAGKDSDLLKFLEEDSASFEPEYRSRLFSTAVKAIRAQEDSYYTHKNKAYGPTGGPLNGRAWIVNAWTVYAGDARESWKHVMLIHAETEHEARVLTSYHVPGGINGHGTGCEFDCSGRAFHSPANIRKMCPGRWIVTQWGALDV